MSDNKCESCDGTGCEFSGVEYMGQHEVVGCAECCGTGFADVSAGVESLRTELTTTRQRLKDLQTDYDAAQIEIKREIAFRVAVESELTVTRQRLEESERQLTVQGASMMESVNSLVRQRSDLKSELATTRQEREALAVFIQERRTHYAQMQGANKGHLFDWFMGKKDFADELLAEIERLKGPRSEMP